MSKKNLSINIIITLVAFALFSCNGNNKADKESETEVIPDDIVEMRDDQIKLAGIEMGVVELRSINSTLRANGKVEVSPQALATVCAPTGGFIKSITLMPGNSVVKGESLALIENQDFIDIQQDFLETKGQFEFAEAEYKRHTDLYKEEVYSTQNMQQVTTEYKRLNSKISALEQKLKMLGINPAKLNANNISSTISIPSPISGFIKTINVNIGRYVTASDVMFEIINTDKLYLNLSLFEKDINNVSKGQKIKFVINNETEQHEAIINQTGNSINEDKTYSVYAIVNSKCKNVLQGMYVTAVIETSDKMVTSVPSGAIVNFDDKDYIFVFYRDKEEDGNPFKEYKIIEVRKGETDGGYTGIALPVEFDMSKSKVVVQGAYNLMAAKKNAGEMAC